MPQRKVWTPEEDRILKTLRDEQGERKWCIIAKRMEDQYNITGRTGKQCRERYKNRLDSAISEAEWSQAEENLLVVLHGEHGNKWSFIASQLPGRTDNFIKNQFYSKLRKSVRKLNHTIQDQYRREYRTIKPSMLSKINETSEMRFRTESPYDRQLGRLSQSIQHRLFMLPDTLTSEEGAKFISDLLRDINLVDLRLKKTKPIAVAETPESELLHPNIYLERSKTWGSDSSDHSDDPSSSSFNSESGLTDFSNLSCSSFEDNDAPRSTKLSPRERFTDRQHKSEGQIEGSPGPIEQMRLMRLDDVGEAMPFNSEERLGGSDSDKSFKSLPFKPNTPESVPVQTDIHLFFEQSNFNMRILSPSNQTTPEFMEDF